MNRRRRKGSAYKAAELDAQCDPDAPLSDDLKAWEQMPDVGHERLDRLESLADPTKAGTSKAGAVLDAAVKVGEEGNERLKDMLGTFDPDKHGGEVLK